MQKNALLEKYEGQIKELSNKKIFSLSDATAIGVSKVDMKKLCEEGIFAKKERAIYFSPTANFTEQDGLDFSIARKVFGPNSYIGGLTALYSYGLMPFASRLTWVVVPLTTRTSKDNYRLIRTRLSTKIGVEKREGYSIASPARAIFDALYFWKVIGGKGIAYNAAREAIKRGVVTYGEVLEVAKKLKHEKTIEQYSQLLNEEALDLI